MPGIKVKTCDGDEIELDADLLKYMPSLRRLNDNENVQLDNENDVIPLNLVSSDTMKAIVDFCKLHAHCHFENIVNKDGPKPTWTLGEVDREFFENRRPLLYDLMKTAHYLEFGELMEATFIYLAEQLRGKSVEEMRAIIKME